MNLSISIGEIDLDAAHVFDNCMLSLDLCKWGTPAGTVNLHGDKAERLAFLARWAQLEGLELKHRECRDPDCLFCRVPAIEAAARLTEDEIHDAIEAHQ